MLRFSETPAMRLRHAYLAMHRRFNAQFAAHGVTADQFVLLSLLNETGPCSQRELVDHVFSDPNTVGAMLRLLERKSRPLVERRPHPHDGRALEVEITLLGREVHALLVRESRYLHQHLTDAVATSEPGGFLHSLRAVAESMDPETATTSSVP